MAERKTFIVRLDPKEVRALQRWAMDEFRSLNGQIEYIVHHALRKHGRLPDEPSSTRKQSASGVPKIGNR